MARGMQRAAGAGLAILLMMAGCAGPPVEGAPSWSFQDTEGVTHSDAEARGNVTVLFFMATWCGSCRQNAPRLAHVWQDLAPQGLRMYTVSWDPTEGADDLRWWMETYQQPWPHGVDRGSAMAQTFGVTAQSSIVVLRPDGSMERRFDYPGATEDALRAAIAAGGQATATSTGLSSESPASSGTG